jgi:PPOX class probable F420-dependent enzyme
VTLSEATMDALVARAPLARLALTIDRFPLVVPIVFAVCDGCLWSPVDGKPKRGTPLARLRAAARDPRAAVLIDHYDDDWSALWWIRIDVLAAPLGRDDLPGGAFEAVAAALCAKYPQYETTPMFTSPPTLLRLRPCRRRGWSAR